MGGRQDGIAALWMLDPIAPTGVRPTAMPKAGDAKKRATVPKPRPHHCAAFGEMLADLW